MPSEKDIVQEARELLAKATPGPLHADKYTGRGGRITRVGTTRHNVIADIYTSDDLVLYARAPELLRALADEVERLRMAVSHAIRRNHDYAPASCDGCADAKKSLTAKDHHALLTDQQIAEIEVRARTVSEWRGVGQFGKDALALIATVKQLRARQDALEQALRPLWAISVPSGTPEPENMEQLISDLKQLPRPSDDALQSQLEQLRAENEAESVQCDQCALSTWAVPDSSCIKQAISGVKCAGTMRAIRAKTIERRGEEHENAKRH